MYSFPKMLEFQNTIAKGLLQNSYIVLSQTQLKRPIQTKTVLITNSVKVERISIQIVHYFYAFILGVFNLVK